MFEAVLASLIIGFGLGVLYSETKSNAKKRARYVRRNKIIEEKNRITNQMTQWDTDHPIKLLSKPKKGKVIFKHNHDQMTDAEFKKALRTI